MSWIFAMDVDYFYFLLFFVLHAFGVQRYYACFTAQYDSRYIGHMNFRRELRFPHRMHSVSFRWGPRCTLRVQRYYACFTAQYDSRYIGHMNFRRELRFPHRMHSVSFRWGPRCTLRVQRYNFYLTWAKKSARFIKILHYTITSFRLACSFSRPKRNNLCFIHDLFPSTSKKEQPMFYS